MVSLHWVRISPILVASKLLFSLCRSIIKKNMGGTMFTVNWTVKIIPPLNSVWSLGWTAHTRREETLKRLTTDPHSPNYFRVNGVLANIPEFWKTFDIPADSPLNLGENFAEIW